MIKKAKAILVKTMYGWQTQQNIQATNAKMHQFSDGAGETVNSSK